MECLDSIYGVYAICACCKYDQKEKPKVNPKSLSGPFVGIGYKNKLPWGSNPIDMKYFTSVTCHTDVKKFVAMAKRRKETKLWNMDLGGLGEGIPSIIPGDLKNVVVMGRLSWESIPKSFKPLKGRINMIMSRSLQQSDVGESAYVVRSVNEVLDILRKTVYYKCFVIGGSQIYKEFIENGMISKIYMTRINQSYDCDVFFPNVSPDVYEIDSVSEVHKHKDVTLDFIVISKKKVCGPGRWEGLEEDPKCMKDDDFVYFKFLEKKKQELGELQVDKSKFKEYLNIQQREHPEYQYLNILYDILTDGNALSDRTGVGVMSKFGYMMRFNLQQYFPLLTTKRVFLRGIIEELLWFIRGETNGNTLLEKNVRIWEANGTREFLDNRKLFHREVNDLGPVYGFQWRHFGAEYVDMHTNYQDQGVDQLKNVIELIKNDPTSRRILLCAWNPKDLEQMALPPCHILCQFYVNNKKLSCIMYQRSCDLGLGVPFNIASYSILTHMIAQVCGLEVHEFIHILGNAHIYKNHINELIVQVNRVPYPFPTMHLNPDVKNIEDFTVNDFTIKNYVHHEKIVMEMAA